MSDIFYAQSINENATSFALDNDGMSIFTHDNKGKLHNVFLRPDEVVAIIEFLEGVIEHEERIYRG